MCDDQGWGDVSYNGLKQIQTPALDAMAAAGLRFHRLYALPSAFQFFSISLVSLSSITRSNCWRPAVLSLGIPISPNARTTRSHGARRSGRSRYTG